MSINVSAMTFSVVTSGNIVVSTSAVAFYGVCCSGSAAGTSVTILNDGSTGGASQVGICSAGVTSSNSLIFSIPIAMKTGLSAVNSGTGSYILYYGLY